MARKNITIKIKLGTDEHVMKKNAENTGYCLKCSVRSICFDMGQTQRKSLCDALIAEAYDYPSDFCPYGGHFELKQ